MAGGIWPLYLPGFCALSVNNKRLEKRKINFIVNNQYPNQNVALSLK